MEYTISSGWQSFVPPYLDDSEVGLNYRESAMPTAATSPVWRMPRLLYQLDASGHVVRGIGELLKQHTGTETRFI